ncbi:MAG: phosphate acyltransferase PlsX [Candidatus Methylacidiphilales bacterium]
MKIALDAMGGDYAPARPVAAAVEALSRFPQISELYLVGHQDRIREELQRLRFKESNHPRLRIHHCTEVIEMGEGAVEGVRKKRDNSINRSVELVKEGISDAVVSAGHTGAMVAATTIKLRTLPGIGRPGIAAIMPTEFNRFVLMDAGANIDAEPDNLLEYGIMGSVFSSHVLGFDKPRVGLLSVGTEESKGNEVTKKAYKLLSDAPINFVGNIEGHDLYERPVEVVVCEGFVGNVVLKTSESLANAVFAWLKREIQSNPLRLVGAALARGAFATIKKRTSYEEIGGSLLLGVNGICVIAHGSSSVKALVNAIGVAVHAVDSNVNQDIIRAMETMNLSPRVENP